jgi:hypothetical protein
MNEYEDGFQLECFGKNDITERVVAICKRGTVPKTPSRQTPREYIDLGNYRFLPNPFQLISNAIFYYFTLYSVDTGNV